MQTPWGDIPVSDAHVHFFSHGFFRLLAAQKPGLQVSAMGSQLGWDMPPEDPADLARQWVRELDRAGIHRAALIASLPGEEASVEAAVAAFPQRFHGYFMVNPLAPNAAQNAARHLAAGHLRVPCLFPAMHRYAMHGEEATAVVEAVASHPRPVLFVHTGVLTVGVRNKLGLPSLFDLRFSNPLDLHALALRFPRVRFILPHLGAGFFREALMLADLCPNVYFDTSSTNSWMRYQEDGCSLARVFRRALDVAGPSRLLFGTDSSFFPRGWHAAVFHSQVDALKEVGIDPRQAAAIFGGNLESLLTV